MSQVIDMTGQTFGLLTVLRRNGSTFHNQALWLCHCRCGRQITTSRQNLVKGHTQSCGCWAKLLLASRSRRRFRMRQTRGAIKRRSARGNRNTGWANRFLRRTP